VRLTGTFLLVFTILFSAGTDAAPQNPDFTGVWKLDIYKSRGVSQRIKLETLKVTQSNNRLDIVANLKMDDGDETLIDQFILDNQEVDFAPKSPDGAPGKGKRTARWSADGMGIEAVETASFETDKGPVEITATRRWTLSTDRKTLTVEQNAKSSVGDQDMLLIFSRQ
jgi:hypothetical protein